MKEDEIWRVFI